MTRRVLVLVLVAAVGPVTAAAAGLGGGSQPPTALRRAPPAWGEGASCGPEDIDADLVPDVDDTCPGVWNPGNADADADGFGNKCDLCPGTADDQLDDDGDGLGDACDACPAGSLGAVCRPAAGECDVAEVCESEADCPDNRLRASGTVCRPRAGSCDAAEECTGYGLDCPPDVDPDADGDGLPGLCDLCPRIADPDQHDSDRDGVGDACDYDDDNDGVDDELDGCPLLPAFPEVDADGDGIPDPCDGHDDRADGGRSARRPVEAAPPGDLDGDGVEDASDDCPFLADPGQEDSDGDGVGDACPFDILEPRPGELAPEYDLRLRGRAGGIAVAGRCATPVPADPSRPVAELQVELDGYPVSVGCDRGEFTLRVERLRPGRHWMRARLVGRACRFERVRVFEVVRVAGARASADTPARQIAGPGEPVFVAMVVLDRDGRPVTGVETRIRMRDERGRAGELGSAREPVRSGTVVAVELSSREDGRLRASGSEGAGAAGEVRLRLRAPQEPARSLHVELEVPYTATVVPFDVLTAPTGGAR